MKYFLYCRKSSEDANRQVQSIDDQKKVMLEMAKTRNLEVGEIFEESQSAKSPGRPKFSEMMERIQKGEAQGILAWKLDRLARNPIDGGSIIWTLQNGIIQKIITSDREYCPQDNVLMMSVEFGMANQFILDLSKNVRRGMTAKYEKGIRPTLTPIGYRNNIVERTVEKDPERFGLVRKMWDLMLSGAYTQAEIAKIARKEWRLMTPKKRRIGGNLIAFSTVYSMFKNIFYAGVIEKDGKRIQGSHPAMITEEEYNRVQKIIGRKLTKRPSEKVFAFTGLLKCGECGCAITAEERSKYIASEKCVRKYVYYHCTKKKQLLTGEKCQQKHISLESLEGKIIALLERIRISERFLVWAKTVLSEETEKEVEQREILRKNLERQVSEATKKLDNLIRLKISDPELLNEEEFRNHKESIMQERNKAQEKLLAVSVRQDEWIDLTEKTLRFCMLARERFETGTPEEKRLIVSCIGSNFVLMNGEVNFRAKNIFGIIEKVQKSGETKKRGSNQEKEPYKAIKSAFTEEIPEWWSISGSNR